METDNSIILARVMVIFMIVFSERTSLRIVAGYITNLTGFVAQHSINGATSMTSG
jgi:hypothetical protein